MYFPFEYLKKQNNNKMKSYSDNLSVRDNLDEISDDVEDDVFIRDGKMSKSYEEKRLKRPLMPPKKLRFKTQNNHHHNHNSNSNYNYHNINNNNNSSCSSSNNSINNNNLSSKNYNKVPIFLKNERKHCWKCCEPLFYGFIGIIILITFIVLGTLLLAMFPVPLQKFKLWLKRDHTFSTIGSQSSLPSSVSGNNDQNLQKNNLNINLMENLERVPCTKISVHKVWSKAISRINSETPIRKVDLNGDQIEDVVIGFGIDEFVQYSDIQVPRCIFSKTDETTICEGGLLAFNGKTGETLWQYWTSYTIFSLYCSTDLTKDGQNDCVAAGRGGLIVAVNGKTGQILWQLNENKPNLNLLIDLYTINPIRDLDGDEISDIITVHVEETTVQKSGHIKLISGVNGNVLRTIPTPYREEVFVPLQFLTQPDGTEFLLIVTGGQNTPGGLYTIRLTSLMQFISESDFTIIFHNSLSGFMVPAVLSDITGDGVEDIIVSSFNSTVYAFDGKSYTSIWNYSFPTSESVSSIVPGYFDNDNITDFMIKYNTGPGFPVYYYSQTTILNGLTGLPFLDDMLTDSGGPNSLLGGLSISQNYGGDLFLHWQTECRNKVESKDAYRFLPDSDIIQQSRADTCLLRFNTSTVLKLYALSRHLEPPGVVAFSTDDLVLQLNQTINNLNKNLSIFPSLKHPKMRLPKNGNNNSFASRNSNIGIVKLQPSNDAQNNILGKKRIDLRDPERERLKMNNRKMVSIENRNMIKDEKPFIYLPYDESERIYKQQIPYDIEQQQDQLKDFNKNNQQPSEYDMLYDTTNEQSNRNYNPMNNINMKFNHLNLNNNHGIRRSSVGHNKTKSDSRTTIPETLWDLELEKENEEAFNNNSENFTEDQSQSIENDKKRRKRRRIRKYRDDNTNENIENLEHFENNMNQNLMSSISSTGVLLSSMEQVNMESNTIDFVFVLNVRESETFPPLYLAEDIECVENKIRNYQNYMESNMLEIEKNFLAQCIQKRIPSISSQSSNQQYETQIVITRITIKCECENLNKNKEICSKFNKITNQKWTGFMGNNGNGVYPN